MNDNEVVELEESIEETGEENTSPEENEKTEEKHAEEQKGQENTAEDGAEGGDTKKRKRKKRSSAYSYMIEVVAVLVVFYVALSGLGGKFRFKKFAPFKVEVTAYVESVDQVVFTGTRQDALEMRDLADSKYMTTFVYEVGGQVHESGLYSKSQPNFVIGQTVTLYVDATDLDSIVSVKQEEK